MKITSIKAREILDSRGNPTIEVDLFAGKNMFRAMVPSGASTGEHEAHELRDDEKRYLGKGVQKAVDNVNDMIAPKLKGMDCKEQTKIDNLMIKLDGTKNKSNLGANAILGISMAVCKAGAYSSKLELYKYISKIAKNKRLLLPVPCFNVINGGKHAGNRLDVQEFMILPTEAGSFKEALKMGSETYHILKNIIQKKYGKDATNVGDEGGFAPNIQSMEDALDLLMEAIEKAGYKDKSKIGLDAASSEFFKDWRYHFEGKILSNEDMLKRYKEIVKKYPIVSIEDPFDQNDFDTPQRLTKYLKDKVQVVGDDLLVTNPERIKKAVSMKTCNALLLKINQIGTITEAVEAYKIAKKAKWNVMISHRSGETEDSFIADLAVGLGTGQIKSGAPCRSERLSKYNRLLRIEEKLGKKAIYGGWK